MLRNKVIMWEPYSHSFVKVENNFLENSASSVVQSFCVWENR